MASNSSSIVISFSIAILLLLILLLLLSYNSKNRRDNNEHFNDINQLNGFNQLINPFEAGSKTMNEILNMNKKKSEEFDNSIASKDPYASSTTLKNTGGIQPNDENMNSYASINGGEVGKEKFTTINEGFESQGVQDPTTCIKKEKLTSKDLLPSDAQDLIWSKINPSSQANIQDQNFLTAGYHIGVNTVGQSLRNANLQLRSEIPNPQVAVSPWLISTIEPDVRSTTLEIGSAPSY
jgi:hypothetical protein